MNKVYQFYGIGPNMIQILNTVSTGRTASILREDGSTSRQIQLGSGFPQGSPPSPNQFNIVEQILLLKFELDPEIEKIKQAPNNPYHELRLPNVPIPVPVPVPVPAHVHVPVQDQVLNAGAVRQYGQSESNGETGKVEAFADDTTPMGKLKRAAIESIKRNLTNFAAISGLKCNVEKSQILLTGIEPNTPVPDFIRDTVSAEIPGRSEKKYTIKHGKIFFFFNFFFKII
jgi:hypothetical protein